MEKELKVKYINPEEPVQDYPGMGQRISITKEECLKEFPDQPERSKREDSTNIRCMQTDDNNSYWICAEIAGSNEWIEMRCSELYGNIERDK